MSKSKLRKSHNYFTRIIQMMKRGTRKDGKTKNGKKEGNVTEFHFLSHKRYAKTIIEGEE